MALSCFWISAAHERVKDRGSRSPRSARIRGSSLPSVILAPAAWPGAGAGRRGMHRQMATFTWQPDASHPRRLPSIGDLLQLITVAQGYSADISERRTGTRDGAACLTASPEQRSE
jgi:hypothetical protein